MKKALIGIVVALAVAATIGYIYRTEVGFTLAMIALEPERSFADEVHPDPPDYANPEHWAALPDRNDQADYSPNGLSLDQQAGAAVDVFFIHPTTYYKSDNWNQPLGDADANTFTDEHVLTNQASVFNSCCKIYAPRYRQATLFSFLDDGNDGQQAIDFAYADVRAAFDYFIKHFNDGRPFIIAGHSQGGKHTDALLKDLKNTAVMERLVAAYPVGYYLDGEGSIEVCRFATQTGCQVTWNTVAPDAQSFRDTSNDICVNPINWRTDGSRADFTENLGAVSFSRGDHTVEPHITDAQCIAGALHVTDVRSPNYGAELFGQGNYHLYDYSFFHMNIRENALARSQAFLARLR